jgi:hypothetical protein
MPRHCFRMITLILDGDSRFGSLDQFESALAPGPQGARAQIDGSLAEVQ